MSKYNKDFKALRNILIVMIAAEMEIIGRIENLRIGEKASPLLGGFRTYQKVQKTYNLSLTVQGVENKPDKSNTNRHTRILEECLKSYTGKKIRVKHISTSMLFALPPDLYDRRPDSNGMIIEIEAVEVGS